MNTFVLATNSGAGSSVMMIVMLAVLFGFTYFTMIKPQKAAARTSRHDEQAAKGRQRGNG